MHIVSDVPSEVTKLSEKGDSLKDYILPANSSSVFPFVFYIFFLIFLLLLFLILFTWYSYILPAAVFFFLYIVPNMFWFDYFFVAFWRFASNVLFNFFLFFFTIVLYLHISLSNSLFQRIISRSKNPFHTFFSSIPFFCSIPSTFFFFHVFFSWAQQFAFTYIFRLSSARPLHFCKYVSLLFLFTVIPSIFLHSPLFPPGCKVSFFPLFILRVSPDL